MRDVLRHWAGTVRGRTPSRSRSSGPIANRLAILSAAVLLSLAAIIGFVAWRSYQVSLREARIDAANLARALDQHTARTIEAVGLNLGIAQFAMERDGLETFARTGLALLTRLAAASSPIRDIAVLGADGSVLVGTREHAEPAGDRSYFTVHRDDPLAGLFISPAFRDRAGDDRAIVVSRRLALPDGRFGGVIAATLDVDYFRRFYRTMEVGPGGVVALLGADGRPLVVHPWRDDGGDLPRLDLAAALPPGAEAGLVTEAADAQGVLRLVAYRRVEALPLVAVVGLAREDALGSWHRQVLVLTGIALAALGLTWLIGLRLGRTLAQQRASETLFRAMFEAASEAQFICRLETDGSFRLEACNRAAAARLGAAPEALVGRPLGGALPAGRAARIEADLRRCLAAGNPIRLQESGDGAGRVFEEVLTPLRDEAGRLDRVLASIREITHLKRAEAETREAVRRLLMAEEIAHVGHWRIDLRDDSMTWSREVFRIHGLEPGSVAPTLAAALGFCHPDDRPAVAASIEAQIASKQPATDAMRIVRPDGSIRHVVTRALCEFGPDGAVAALFGTLSDVTELRRVEREAAEAASLLATTLESMDQGLIVVSPEGRIEICNARALALLGLPPELMAGKPTTHEVLEHQWRSGEFAGAEEEVRRLMRAGGIVPEPHTYTRVRPNGTVLEIRTMPMAGGGLVRTYTDITARRQAEEALRESESRHRLIAENVSDVITLRRAGGDGALLYVSPAIRTVLGYAPEDFAARPAESLLHPEDRDRVAAVTAAIDAARPTATSVHRLRHRDGHWVFVETALTWMQGEGARGARILAAMRDVSRRVAAEAAVRESEMLYRLLAETTSDVITRLDLGLAWQYVSPACRAVLGYEPEDLLRQRPSAVVHPDDLPALQDLARRLAAGEIAGEHVTTTFRTRHGRGGFVWTEAGLSLMRDEGGAPVSIVCSLRDVTARKAAEAALEASEARYRFLSENGSDMIVQADRDSVRRYVSPACREILGYEPEEIVGTKPLDGVHPDDRAALAATLADLAAGTRDVATSRQRYRRRDGSYVWVEAKFRLLRDAEGRAEGYVASVRDVSERQRQAEALELARDAAEQASRAKTDFLASMSHEIRTPLNGILGYTDLLLDDPSLGGGQRRQAERIQSAGAALLTIVNDILDFSKIEAGQIELDPQPFLLDALLDNTVSVVRGFARKKAIAVAVRLDGAAPRTLVGDQDRLRQILLNLLNNAVKFTHAGSVTLAVACESPPGATACLRFAVSDTGIGIPRDKHERLFQRFSQVDNSIRRDFGGTGLGLAISKNLVELMGGTIGVESVVSEGTTFWFTVTLPVGGAVAAPAAPGRAALAQLPARILLVEDLEINQDIARAVLEAAGHEVDVASDGLEAIVAVQAKSFDLVLMDVQMPGMDGLTATRHIRALRPPVCTVPIVAMTANVLPAQIAEFRAAGMDDHVGKPFKRDDLHRVVARWSRAQERARPLPPGAPDGPVLDRAVYESARGLLGPQGVTRQLARLVAQLDERLGEARLSPEDRDRLAGDAHAIVAASGQLGFVELSRACAALEAACESGLGLDPAVARVRAARRRALLAIEGLRAVA